MPSLDALHEISNNPPRSASFVQPANATGLNRRRQEARLTLLHHGSSEALPPVFICAPQPPPLSLASRSLQGRPDIAHGSSTTSRDEISLDHSCRSQAKFCE